MRFDKLFARKQEAGVSLETQPRAQHYQFAHRFLPDMARRQGAAFLMEFSGERAHSTLLEMWRWLGEKVPETERARPDGLNVEVRIHSPYAIVLFTLPTPQAITEAYFTALTVSLLPHDETAPDENGGQNEAASAETSLAMRYFTLEYGANIVSQEKRTVLCEWAYENGGVSHLNMGTGPEPELDAFYNRVCVLLG